MPLQIWTGKEPVHAHAEKSVQTQSPATLVTGTTIFRVLNGPIIITQLMSYCVTVCDASAATLQWSADGDVGAATTFSAASGSLAAFAAGGVVYCNFATLATAPIVTGTTGVALSSVFTTGVIVPAGIITSTVASGPTTGTFTHYMRFIPMSPNSTVTHA